MSTEFLNPARLKRPLRILHLEDDSRDRALVEQRLQAEELHCEFVRARTREEFEYALNQETGLDLILADFSIPGYDGSTALAYAREQQPHVPFLFVSGTIGEDHAIETLKAGATDYVIKDRLHRLTPAIFRALRESADRARRRAAEEALRESEQRFRTVFENAPIGVINAGVNGHFLRTNRTLQQMLGYSESELQAISFTEITYEEDLELGHQGFADLISGKTDRFRVEKRYRRKDGTVIWVQLTAAAIRDSSETFQYFVVLVEDLTGTKQAEDLMRDQATLLDLAHDAIVVKDAADCVIGWNRGAEQLYGWKAAEVLGRKVTAFLYPDPAAFHTIKQALLNHADWSGELRQLTRDGKMVDVNSRATLLRDHKGNPKAIMVINSDITEKKKLEAQFLRAQRLESIGTLASGIAHDLNNILAPISIAVQILRFKQMDKDGEQMLDRIESSAHRGADVVRQVLTFARGIEGDRALLQPRYLLKEVVKIAQDTFPKSIDISYSVEDLWPIMGDATQLHQVLLNLCVNARDAMPDGGTLRLTGENIMIDQAPLLIPGAKPGPHVLLQVKDSGEGIPPAIMEKIFEPFFTTKEPGKGTGLGLSTVVGIVKSHGGWINVYSEPGHGAVFKLYLPAVPNEEVTKSSQSQSALPQGRGQTILLVEDESAIREVMRKILVRHGYQVLEAVDGVDGHALFLQHADKVQLVLTDMMMPRMEGMALIRSLKKLNPRLKIIATSGLANLSDQKERQEELKTLGVRDFLPKPCSAEQLLKLIYNTLA
jgi:PAS domain S-box-containing protein